MLQGILRTGGPLVNFDTCRAKGAALAKSVCIFPFSFLNRLKRFVKIDAELSGSTRHKEEWRSFMIHSHAIFNG